MIPAICAPPPTASFSKPTRTRVLRSLGVSLDVNVGTWQKAIEIEKMDWRHLSDMKENHGDITRFRLKGIPANILMNQQGKIVAVDISPEKLKEKLQKQL